MIATHLIAQAGIERSNAATGAVTLIQRFGSAANLNIHLHGLWLDGVYEAAGGGAPHFHPVPPPTTAQLETLLAKLIQRIMRLLTKAGHLIEEEGVVYLASTDPDPEKLLASLQAASSTWRIAQGARAGRNVLSIVGRDAGCGEHSCAHRSRTLPAHCVNAHGFSLHAGGHCEACDRQGLEQLCRTITRSAIANQRLSINGQGQVVLKLKTAWHNGTTHLVLEAMEFMQRLAALVPRPRLHLTRFHGVLAPNAKRRPKVVPKAAPTAPAVAGHSDEAAYPHQASGTMRWAQLLKRVFDIDIARCACGGTLKRIAVPSTGSGQGSSGRT